MRDGVSASVEGTVRVRWAIGVSKTRGVRENRFQEFYGPSSRMGISRAEFSVPETFVDFIETEKGVIRGTTPRLGLIEDARAHFTIFWAKVCAYLLPPPGWKASGTTYS
ncbi:MAG: hypothetical protein ABH969_00145 [Pseudomonadota bacterium]